MSMNYEQFAASLNDRFQIHLSEEKIVAVDLIEVSDFKKSAVQESFWLVFRGSNSEPLGQGTYTFVHPKLGRLEIFMTPIKQDKEGLYYECVFNRLVDSKGDASA